MPFLQSLAGYAAPIFLISSPIFSYFDQALSMHRKRSSAGFSLDIPLIMLVASIIRIFYWPGARFDTALLIQAFSNIFMQVILLKIALDNRPSPSSKGGEAATPFAGANDGLFWGAKRPYNFWRWRSAKLYWQFLLYLFIALTVLELLIAPFHVLYPTYSNLLGIIGLSIEATLPLPQLFSNARSQSCRGFRLSVLASWLFGDALKMFWFFTSTTAIPWSFKLCGIFQAACDVLLGIQYLMYGSEEPVVKSPQWPYAGVKPHLPRMSGGRATPTGRRTPMGEKTF